MAATPSTPVQPVLSDVQGEILEPYDHACGAHLFVSFPEPSGAREFVRSLIPHLSTAADSTKPVVERPAISMNIGFTFGGLTALALPEEDLASFPYVFRVGMAHRAPILGDTGHSAPDQWDAPYGSPEVHCWIMVQAQSTDERDWRISAIESRAQEFGVQILPDPQLTANFTGAQAGAKEHFGFMDGIGEPTVEGSPAPAYPGGGRPTKDWGWDPIKLGSFLLGYESEYGNVKDSPASPKLRLNGTFMAFRKLEQHVTRFRDYIERNKHLVGGDHELLAAKMVGRWRSGAPLELAPYYDDPELARDPWRNNDFRYADDKSGLNVPHLAHIRRMNPRDSLPPESPVDPARHRIIRRSMPYGPWLPEGQDPGPTPRGLIFRVYNASLRDQFELVQSQWVASANEQGGLSTDQDVIAGLTDPVQTGERRLQSTMRIPREGGDVTLYGLPRFVTLKGGDYFFVPGIAALEMICDMPLPKPATPPSPPPETPSFLERWKAVTEDPSISPGRRATLQRALVAQYGGEYIRQMCVSLLESDEYAVLETPDAVFATKYRDVLEVFNRDDVFSVTEYGRRMAITTGAFMLGMDRGVDYQHDHAVVDLAMPDSDLSFVQAWSRNYSQRLVSSLTASTNQIDVVQNVAYNVPVAFVGQYYGVPGPDQMTFLAWLELLAAYIFNWNAAAMKELASAAGLEMQSYLQSVIDQRKAEIAAGQPAKDDVLGRLLSAQVSPSNSLDDVGIRRNLGGLLIGNTMPPCGSIAFALDLIMQLNDPESPNHDPRAYQTCVAAALDDDTRLLQSCMLEAARLTLPEPPSLFRTATEDYWLARGTPRQTLIRKGTTVVCVPSSAMMDGDMIDEPNRFRVDRPAWNYVMFGQGMHECLGREIGTILMAEAARPILRLPGLRRAPGAAGQLRMGDGFPFQFYPGHMVLEFDR